MGSDSCFMRTWLVFYQILTFTNNWLMIYQKSIYTWHQCFPSVLSSTKYLKLNLYYKVIRKAERDTWSFSREQEKAGWGRPKHLSLLESLNVYSCSKTLKNINKEQKNPWCYFFLNNHFRTYWSIALCQEGGSDNLKFQNLQINCVLEGCMCYGGQALPFLL